MKLSYKAVGSFAMAVITVTATFHHVLRDTDLLRRYDRHRYSLMYCHRQTGELGKVKEGNVLPDAVKGIACKESADISRSGQQVRVGELPIKTITALLDGSYNAGAVAACRCPQEDERLGPDWRLQRGFPGKASPLDIGG